MSLQCRKSFEFENSKFSNCLSCAKKKHTAKCLVCRVPSFSTRRSGLFAVCPMRHTAKFSAVNLCRPRPPPFATSAREWHVHEVCRVFWGWHTAKIVICRVFGFAVCSWDWHTTNRQFCRVRGICRVFYFGHTEKWLFAVCSSFSTRQTIWHTSY